MIHTSIFDLFAAAVRVYGRLSLEELRQLYERYYEPIDSRTFLHCAQCLEQAGLPFVLLSHRDIYTTDAQQEDWQVAERELACATWDNLFTLEAAQEGLPLCYLPKEAFLAYGDYDYMPSTPQLQALEEYFAQQVVYDGDRHELLEEAYQQAREDNLPLQCLQELQRMGVSFGDLTQRREFVKRYQNLLDTVRQPALRGHTRQELCDLPISQERKGQHFFAWFCPPKERDKELSDEVLMKNIQPCGETLRKGSSRQAVLSSEYPPRLFDPCPCGSGLYYTDCCGKR